MSDLVFVKLAQAFGLHHPLGAIVREDAVEVERDPQFVIVIVDRGGLEDPAGRKVL